MTAYTLRARWIFPVARPPIHGGSVSIVDGHLASVGERTDGEAIDLGDVAILPGLVNAHSHLDLSLSERPPAPRSFAEWLGWVVASRQDSDPVQAIQAGIKESIATGLTAIGDISAAAESGPFLAEAGMEGVVYHEVLGRRPERYLPRWRRAEEAQAWPPVASSISPHSPYGAAREVYRRAGSRVSGTPLQTHWLESAEEIEFLKTGTGPIRRFLDSIGALEERFSPLGDPWTLLEASAVRWTLVHGNFLTDDDIGRLSSADWKKRIAGVVYCPRTHDYFGHPPHPWNKLHSAGITVALGTDSLASNPDLSVFEEARFLAERHPDVSPESLLQMMTADGATVLGLAPQLGTIAPGCPANLTFLSAPEDGKNVGDILFTSRSKIVGSIARGRWLWRDETFFAPRLQNLDDDTGMGAGRRST